MKLEKLTPGQEAKLARIRDEWIAAGLSCASARRELAVEGVNLAYQTAGLTPPSIVIWLDSPLAGVYGSWYAEQLLKALPKAQVWDQVRAQVRDQVWDQVEDQVRDQVWDQVGDQVRDQVRAQVWDQVWAQVRAQVRDQVWDQVRDQVWDQVWAQVRDQVRAQVRDQILNSVNGYYYDVAWTAFYDTFRQFGVEGAQKIAGLAQVAKNAGWWFPMCDVVVITERPTELHRDPQGRLHNESGPAIRYPDGWGLWMWHGTRVPQDLVEQGWDMERILSERNAEVRRCAAEKLGVDEFEKHLTIVAEAPDPGNAPYTLKLAELPTQLRDMYADSARLLLCTNGSVERDGTRRRFALPVPAHHTDPVAAAADMYDWPVEAYRNLQVRR